MRLFALLPTVLAASAVASVNGQNPRIIRVEPGTALVPGAHAFSLIGQPRAVIGVTTSGAATTRDTLGVLVTSVRAGSPAEKAGLEEGNRIASVNGVSLKLSPADVDDPDMAGVMTRRLTRELDKLKPGDEVDLRVYANRQTKTMKIKTIAPEDLYESRLPRRDADRATLGLDIAVTGSARDTLGVFVIGVQDGSPAAKAGIEEGSRIASINGVDVRGRRSSDEDELVFRASNLGRLEREVSRLKPGDDVELRVYFNGQFRNVKMKAARMADLPRRNRSIRITSGDGFMVPRIPDRIEIDGAQIGDEVRRALETARVATSGAMQGMGRALGRFGNRVEW
ncbi:MAG: PDZ domain-containing protein [Gemmatimonas sp.]